MTALTDEQLYKIYGGASGSAADALRAVADAAIAADRAARAEPVAWIIQWDNDPDDVVTSMHNYDLQQALGAGWPIQYLYTAPPAAPVVPDGWKLVPEVPTSKMYKAGWDEFDSEREVSIRRVYLAMLAAAPAPSQDNGGAA